MAQAHQEAKHSSKVLGENEEQNEQVPFPFNHWVSFTVIVHT